jgi:hypothetical protein
MTTVVRIGWFGNCIGSLYHQPTKMEQMTQLLKAIQEMMETRIGSLASLDGHQPSKNKNQPSLLGGPHSKGNERTDGKAGSQDRS